MLSLNHLKLFVLCLGAITACGQNRYEPMPHEYEQAINTESKVIELQPKKQYQFPAKNMVVDNLFDGARLNSARLVGNTLKLIIGPESIPVNGSSWYAFRITSTKKQSITLELNYAYASHRYAPKWSENGSTWTPINPKKIRSNKPGTRVWFTITLPSGPIWIAAQEVISSKNVLNWCSELAQDDRIKYNIIGKSALGRDIPCLDISAGKNNRKPIIAILGRQHPPEVTGHLALKSFIERLLEHKQAEAFFEKYRLIVFPIINPDGVDLGHWRYNAQGIDLNRDYAQYNQPEVKAVTNFLVRTAGEENADVIIGLDFHSTYEDVYYTNQETEGVALAPLKDQWLTAIQEELKKDNYTIKEEKHSVHSNPSAQHWFYHQFKALGITYEIGDNTPRDLIKVKAKISADALVRLLISNYGNDQ